MRNRNLSFWHWFRDGKILIWDKYPGSTTLIKMFKNNKNIFYYVWPTRIRWLSWPRDWLWRCVGPYCRWARRSASLRPPPPPAGSPGPPTVSGEHSPNKETIYFCFHFKSDLKRLSHEVDLAWWHVWFVLGLNRRGGQFFNFFCCPMI